MTKLYTTLTLLREHGACRSGYAGVLREVGSEHGKDAQIDLLTILDSSGVCDTLWALRATNDDSAAVVICVEFAEWCAAAARARARARAAAARVAFAGDAFATGGAAAAADAYAYAADAADAAAAHAARAARAAAAADAAAAAAAAELCATAYTGASTGRIEKLREMLS